MALKFRSYLGHQPWFFVPDTGAPGGTATLSGPNGVKECTETQTTTGEHSSFGPRVGFQVPAPFTDEGTYLLSIVQDSETTVYEIDVVEPGEPAMELTVGE